MSVLYMRGRWLLASEPAHSWCCLMRRLCGASSGPETRSSTDEPSAPASDVTADPLSCHGAASPSHTITAPPSTDQRVLRAAILGTPNAGKSTLVNKLIGQKVFAVSPKVHTTKRRAIGVFTEGSTQVILLDTPGVVPYQYGRRLRLSREFMTDPQHSLVGADLALVLVDAANKRTRERFDPALLHTLTSNPHIPTVLVLNKVDIVRYKHILLHVTEALTGAIERLVGGEKGSEQRSHDPVEESHDPVGVSVESREPVGVLEKSHDPVGVSEESHDPVGVSEESHDPVGVSEESHDPVGVSEESHDPVGVSEESHDPVGVSEESHDPVGVSEESHDPVGVSEESHDPVSVSEESHDPVGREGVTRRPVRPDFDKVFMISALTGDGVEELKSYLVSCAGPGQWEYVSGERTDQPSSVLVEDIVREKLFVHLRKEIPYVITQDNVIWERTDSGVTIYQNLNCSSSSQVSIVIGPGGSTIQKITEEARVDIEAVLRCPVDLTLKVRTKKK